MFRPPIGDGSDLTLALPFVTFDGWGNRVDFVAGLVHTVDQRFIPHSYLTGYAPFSQPHNWPKLLRVMDYLLGELNLEMGNLLGLGGDRGPMNTAMVKKCSILFLGDGCHLLQNALVFARKKLGIMTSVHRLVTIVRGSHARADALRAMVLASARTEDEVRKLSAKRLRQSITAPKLFVEGRWTSDADTLSTFLTLWPAILVCPVRAQPRGDDDFSPQPLGTLGLENDLAVEWETEMEKVRTQMDALHIVDRLFSLCRFTTLFFERNDTQSLFKVCWFQVVFNQLIRDVAAVPISDSPALAEASAFRRELLSQLKWRLDQHAPRGTLRADLLLTAALSCPATGAPQRLRANLDAVKKLKSDASDEEKQAAEIARVKGQEDMRTAVETFTVLGAACCPHAIVRNPSSSYIPENELSVLELQARKFLQVLGEAALVERDVFNHGQFLDTYFLRARAPELAAVMQTLLGAQVGEAEVERLNKRGVRTLTDDRNSLGADVFSALQVAMHGAAAKLDLSLLLNEWLLPDNVLIAGPTDTQAEHVLSETQAKEAEERELAEADLLQNVMFGSRDDGGVEPAELADDAPAAPPAKNGKGPPIAAMAPRVGLRVRVLSLRGELGREAAEEEANEDAVARGIAARELENGKRLLRAEAASQRIDAADESFTPGAAKRKGTTPARGGKRPRATDPNTLREKELPPTAILGVGGVRERGLSEAMARAPLPPPPPRLSSRWFTMGGVAKLRPGPKPRGGASGSGNSGRGRGRRRGRGRGRGGAGVEEDDFGDAVEEEVDQEFVDRMADLQRLNAKGFDFEAFYDKQRSGGSRVGSDGEGDGSGDGEAGGGGGLG